MMVFGAERAHNSIAIKWVLLCNLDSLDKERVANPEPVGMRRMLVYAPGYRLKIRRSLRIIRAKQNFRLFLPSVSSSCVE